MRTERTSLCSFDQIFFGQTVGFTLLKTLSIEGLTCSVWLLLNLDVSCVSPNINEVEQRQKNKKCLKNIRKLLEKMQDSMLHTMSYLEHFPRDLHTQKKDKSHHLFRKSLWTWRCFLQRFSMLTIEVFVIWESKQQLFCKSGFSCFSLVGGGKMNYWMEVVEKPKVLLMFSVHFLRFITLVSHILFANFCRLLNYQNFFPLLDSHQKHELKNRQTNHRIYTSWC